MFSLFGIKLLKTISIVPGCSGPKYSSLGAERGLYIVRTKSRIYDLVTFRVLDSSATDLPLTTLWKYFFTLILCSGHLTDYNIKTSVGLHKNREY